ncbi:hypothetical protein BDF14DRAFT_1842763 [Spinellus fusiger]|nr:hypothetical protein BDF14DRAFT_1842763 [Spinellus fusiger]
MPDNTTPTITSTTKAEGLVQMDISSAQNLFEKKAPTFTSTIESMDIETWKGKMAQLDPYIKVILLQTKLAGPAAFLADLHTCDTPEKLYLLLGTIFPVHTHRTKTLVKLDKGDYFAGYTAITCVQEAQRTYHLLTPSDAAAHTIATALYKTFPQVWNFTGKSPSLVTEANFEKILVRFSEFAEITLPVAKAPYPQTEGALRQQNLTPESHHHIQQAPHTHHQMPHQKRRPRENCSGYQDLER